MPCVLHSNPPPDLDPPVFPITPPHLQGGSRAQSQHDSVVIECEFTLATFSTATRRSRFKGDRRSTELGLRIAKTLEAAVLSHLYPRSRIDIFVQVLQSDGGEGECFSGG